MLARRHTKRIVASALGILAAAGAGLLLLAWSGVYNIAASRGHWNVVEWFLAFGMRNSVELRSRGIEVPPLDDANLVTLGAAHFHSGCAYCHGAPGMALNPIAQSMLPPPPELSSAASQWKDNELFWIVKHGIKYTGMPAWAAQARDDEVWALVAFIKRLPVLDGEAYRALALGGLEVPSQSGREFAIREAADEAVSACARCHGAEGRAPASALTPLLHGQPREFLVGALRAYAEGRRGSGIMQPVASDLPPNAVEKVAGYYAGLRPPARTPARTDVQRRTRGRSLATDGLPAARVPSCMPCHEDGALASYPRLAGQSAAYMAGRLRRWRDGVVDNTVTDAIMAPIARRLTNQQIEDVSAYFASSHPEAE